VTKFSTVERVGRGVCKGSAMPPIPTGLGPAPPKLFWTYLPTPMQFDL